MDWFLLVILPAIMGFLVGCLFQALLLKVLSCILGALIILVRLWAWDGYGGIMIVIFMSIILVTMWLAFGIIYLFPTSWLAIGLPEFIRAYIIR